MTCRRTVVLACATVALIVFARPNSAQSQEKYKVRLSTVPMDGGMREAVAGSGAATVMLAGTKLTINGTFQGLRTPATGAHLHRGVATGVRGSPLAALTVSRSVNGTITGSIDLTPEQVEGLKK